ncbi:CocE/NonD family hydrolase [Streptomyces sp. NPDC052687]|uniref:CocE/NonD family hydrolase n=1 Tax=Streptomyces sp. NPDC052687 TaxID=3154759 RepID=UPI0034406978
MTTYTTAVHGLATDIRLPDGPGPFPAVLVRTPYDRRAHHAELRGWARRGFAAVAQDVRGRHGSAGEWRPYAHEAADGADTARWIRRRPWSDGRIVAYGASYAAHCAVTLALDAPEDARPDAVIAAVPALGAADTAREPSGAERLLTRAGWWAAHGDRPDSDEGALDKALAGDPDALTHLPLLDLPRRLGRELPSWPGLWHHRDRGRLIARAPRARMPLLAVGGHHDHFAEDTVELWRHWGGPCPRLLMGPWGHGLVAAPGPDAHPAHRVRLGDLYARWARSALAGHLTGGRGGAVALGGSPLWTAADLEGEPYAPRLRPLRGTAFTAHPEHPVSSAELTVPVDGEPDRCVLVTAPLPRPLDLLGPARVRLRARAATPSADWFARLVALAPAGPARTPAVGPAADHAPTLAGEHAPTLAPARAGERAGGQHAERLAVGVVRRHGQPPGQTAEFSIPLGRIARRLPAGTRLRLEIAGHHFPAHARNPHTGEDPITATRLIPSAREVDPDRLELRLSVLRTRPTPTDPAEEILR